MLNKSTANANSPNRPGAFIARVASIAGGRMYQFHNALRALPNDRRCDAGASLFVVNASRFGRMRSG
jgi:hypothetical protein